MNSALATAINTERTGSAESKPTLLVFSDDWGRHPSSCQHLIGHLLPDHRVMWVNTIGMRPPRLNWSTMTRGVEKLRQWFGPAAEPDALPANLSIVKPLMWPWMRRPLDRRVNRRLLVKRLRAELSQIDGPVIAVTTIPIVADLMGELPVDGWVYYCVDDFSVWPGLDQKPMQQMEHTVIARADAVIAASDALRRRLSAERDDVHLLTHGVDVVHWNPSDNLPPVAALESIPGPRVTFWGLIDRRMDIEWIKALSASLEQGRILLTGPADNPWPELESLQNVHRVGRLDYGQLPAVAGMSDVLIMPYADLPVTRAMQPLKLLEYLSTSKPVVVRDLPANRAWAGALDLAQTTEEFVAAVKHRLATGLPEDQREARRRVLEESWDAKAERFQSMILQSAAKTTAVNL